MAAVTTRNGPAPIKPFAWSYSRMKNFEACPKKNYEVDLIKSCKEPQSEHLLWGDRVHKGLASHVQATVAWKQGLIADRAPIPTGLEEYEHWVDKVVGDGSGLFLVEHSFALTKEFAPCDNFAKNAWFRAKGDLTRVLGDIALVGDWKTGKILEDSQQLALAAACVFATYPQVQAVRSEFFWLAENATTSETFYRKDIPFIWKGIWHRIEAMEHAHKTTTYQAKPSGLCKRHCPVTTCPYHGKGTTG